MSTKRNSTRAPREAPPPSIWGKTRSGSYFRVVKLSKRNARGEKLYRLWWIEHKVKGTKEWTLAELVECGVRWLKRRPPAARS